MKQLFYAIAAFAALAITASCSKEQASIETKVSGVKIALQVVNGTKAKQTTWENGNVIYAFFDTDISADKWEKKAYVKMTYKDGAWDAVCEAPQYLDTIPAAGKIQAFWASSDDFEKKYVGSGSTERYNFGVQSSASPTSGWEGIVHGTTVKKSIDYLTCENADYIRDEGVVYGTLNFVRRTDFLNIRMSFKGFPAGHEIYMKQLINNNRRSECFSNMSMALYRTGLQRVVSAATTTYVGTVERNGEYVTYNTKRPNYTVKVNDVISINLWDETAQVEYTYSVTANQELVDLLYNEEKPFVLLGFNREKFTVVE